MIAAIHADPVGVLVVHAIRIADLDLADLVALEIVDHVVLAADHADQAATHAIQCLIVEFVPQLHHAPLVAQVIHLAAHQCNVKANLSAQLGAHLAAHKVWMARR